jgi:hypothetical protein
MERLMTIAQSSGLLVFEDTAQAFYTLSHKHSTLSYTLLYMIRRILTRTERLPSYEDKKFIISSAVSAASLKGEDRHGFSSSRKLRDSGIGVIFAGVFDGHDGEECSEYCRVGMLPHIVESFNRRVQEMGGGEGTGGGAKYDKDGSFEILKASMIEGCHDAQDSFEKFQVAPALGGDAKVGSKVTASPPSSLSRLLRCQCGPIKRRGGTTVNCLLVQSLDDQQRVKVVVANCGDSRCITDGGTGSLDGVGKLGEGGTTAK